ncbi:hypothetical protein LMH87_011290 [Akanthomyces muscarius]|uniref:Uncharacterized protein n=1 Tax=Akanthomyces muscarius TaxID=2231603 RepID=A0A9W8UKL6_AKAMU|nr:hypothetical protein LMH87_011290 [Akanthomyces muscarius]KAJ4150544.1 hypothetical protein LMH87_011290 [Akanthomyces muscarius]
MMKRYGYFPPPCLRAILRCNSSPRKASPSDYSTPGGSCPPTISSSFHPRDLVGPLLESPGLGLNKPTIHGLVVVEQTVMRL